MMEVSNVSVLTVFAAGLVSLLSPCVRTLVPGYVSLDGQSAAGGGGGIAVRMPAIGLSSCFVLGFSTVFIVLRVSATALGQMLIRYRYELNIGGGAIVIVFGLFLIGLVRPAWMMREFRFHAALPAGGRCRPMCWGSPSRSAGRHASARSSEPS